MVKNFLYLLAGAAICAGAFLLFGNKPEEVNKSEAIWPSKIVYSSQKTEGYYFPTHDNLLIMDRAYAEKVEVFIVQIAPGKATHRHVHPDTEQLYYILSGEGSTTMQRDGMEEEIYSFKPGDVVHIPRNSYHQTFCDSADSLKYLAVDCFPDGKNPDEPTWDEHAHAICLQNGWDYDEARIKKTN